MKKFTMPGEDTIRMIVAAVLLVGVIAFIWYALHTRDTAKTADALVDKVGVLEDSAALSAAASEQAGKIMHAIGQTAAKDREIINEARRPGATVADRKRVHERAAAAYAEGLGADCRLQRAECGTAASGTAKDR